MQPIVGELVKLGVLPDSLSPDVAKLQKIQALLAKVEQPVSDDDARALVKLFGSDECFGLAWTLLHLIETAPGWPLYETLGESENEWVDRLKQRENRTKTTNS